MYQMFVGWCAGSRFIFLFSSLLVRVDADLASRVESAPKLTIDRPEAKVAAAVRLCLGLP